MAGVQVGSRLGRYELLAEIGHGGMSVVYRARDLQLQRDVAVKVLHPFLAEQKEARVRFEREAVAVARLHHPHIIEIFDYSDSQTEATYIVTELVDGHPLSDWLDKGAFAPPEIAVLLARPVVDALRTAHAAGIIHRDLKPENILVSRSGTLKLTDFGIARLLDNQTLTVTGTLLGSPAYMAPEYIDGQATDERADIFSLGVMLYQMTVGSLPFAGPSPHALFKKIAGGEYMAPDQANPHIHAALARMIRRCLALAPADRYPNATALLADMDAFIGQLDLDAEPERVRALAEPAAPAAALIGHLEQRYFQLGQAALAAKQTGIALEHFDRVLGLHPEHPEVRRILRRLSQRTFSLRLLGGLAGLLAAGAGVWTVVNTWNWSAPTQQRPSQTDQAPDGAVSTEPTPAPADAPTRQPVTFILQGRGELFLDNTLMRRESSGSETFDLPVGPHTARFVGNERADARAFIVSAQAPPPAVRLDIRHEAGAAAGPTPAASPTPGPTAAPTAAGPTPTPVPDAAPETRSVEFKPAGQWVTLYVDGNAQPVVKEEMRTFTVPLSYGKHHLRFINDKAQPLELDLTVNAHEPMHAQLVRLRPLDAKLRIVGAPDGAVVEVAGRLSVLNEHTRDDPIFVSLPEGQGVKEYEVVVRTQDGKHEFLRQPVLFRPGEEQTLAIGAKPL